MFEISGGGWNENEWDEKHNTGWLNIELVRYLPSAMKLPTCGFGFSVFATCSVIQGSKNGDKEE